MDMREAFARAYKDGQWHNGSGSGSSPANTAAYRRFLAGYMREHQVRSVLDLGCGDWQTGRLIDWTGIDYLGVDIVDGVVQACEAQFSAPGVRFCQSDILAWTFMPAADLILCKDLLQHWPENSIDRLALHLDGRRALITCDYWQWWLPDIEPGGYRALAFSRFHPRARPVLAYDSISHEGRVRRQKVTWELAP